MERQDNKVVIRDSEGQMMRVMEEFRQISLRKDNLSLFGSPEREAGSLTERKARDKTEVGMLAAALDDIKRVGHSRTMKSAPLKLKYTDPEAKQLLVNRKRIKRLRFHEKYQRVYVSHDFTKLQPNRDRRLRTELKQSRENDVDEDVVIRSGEKSKRTTSTFYGIDF